MYYAFVGKRRIDSSRYIQDARQDIIEKIFYTRRTGYISTDPMGRNIVEYLKSGNIDKDECPILSRKAGQTKWRDVSADGEIFVKYRNGNGRFYERK